MDVFDRQGAIAAGKKASQLKPHPLRPWATKTKKRVSDTKAYSPAQTINILDRMRQGLIH